jgi:long-chain acyl-CoA synthetase
MDGNDAAVIVYTSGTTGQPKGAVLSHNNVVSNIEAKVRYLGILEQDRLLLFLPLFHCFGQNAIFNAALERERLLSSTGSSTKRVSDARLCMTG